MTGQKLSTAVGKGLKTAAMGFAAGKIFDAIKELIPPEVAKTFISSDGQQIDLTKIPGMSATDAASMSPEEIKELLQTQKALMTAAKSSLDGEVQQEITQAVQQVTQKINELGGANQLMQQAGIKGSDLTMQMMQATSDATGDVQTFTDAYTITADELQNVGINFATEPPISDAVKQWAQSKGLNVDALQKAFQMEKAMDDAQFLGTAIQSETAIETWASSGLPTPSVTSTDLKDTLVIGQQQSMNIVTKIPGLDKPIGLTTSFTFVNNRRYKVSAVVSGQFVSGRGLGVLTVGSIGGNRIYDVSSGSYFNFGGYCVVTGTGTSQTITVGMSNVSGSTVAAGDGSSLHTLTIEDIGPA
jgi:rRNA maturation endonuclease Nob1